MTKEMLNVRVSNEQKAKLESLATQQGCSVSDVIRGWIDTDGVWIEIPSDCAETVALCAELQEQSVEAFVKEYLEECLQDSIGGRCYALVDQKVKQFLKEKPMSKDELAAFFPEAIREKVSYHVDWLFKYDYIEKTPDEKYQLTEQGRELLF